MKKGKMEVAMQIERVLVEVIMTNEHAKISGDKDKSTMKREYIYYFNLLTKTF